jgi:hypothetical protein
MAAGASFGWSDSNSAELRDARLKAVREQGNGVGLPPPSAYAFAVTEGGDFDWVQRRLRPMPLQTYLGKITLKNKGSAGLRRTYIAAVRPPYLPLVATHERVKADKSWSFTPIEAGHDAMIIAPYELSALLMEA